MTDAQKLREFLDKYEELGKDIKRGFDSKSMHADEPCDEFLEVISICRKLLDACEFYGTGKTQDDYEKIPTGKGAPNHIIGMRARKAVADCINELTKEQT